MMKQINEYSFIKQPSVEPRKEKFHDKRNYKPF